MEGVLRLGQTLGCVICTLGVFHSAEIEHRWTGSDIYDGSASRGSELLESSFGPAR